MGRKTYEFVARHGGSAGSPSIGTYIFSTTMAAAPKGSTLVKEDAVGFVTRLKAAEGGKIFLFGGGELASILIDAGLVDEIECGIQPVLLGGGTPMFRPMTRRIALERLEARELAGDGVFVRYRLQSPPKGPPQTAHVSTDLAPA